MLTFQFDLTEDDAMPAEIAAALPDAILAESSDTFNADGALLITIRPDQLQQLADALGLAPEDFEDLLVED